MFNVCSLYVHCIFTICSLYVHYIPVGGYSVFYFNLKLSDARLCIIDKNFSKLLQKILDLWIRISYQEPSNATEIFEHIEYIMNI